MTSATSATTMRAADFTAARTTAFTAMRTTVLAAVVVIAAAAIALAGFSTVALAKTYSAGVSAASEGNVLLGVKGAFNNADESKAALAQVNKYRKANGVPALKWSNDVERAGRIYTAEAAVSRNSVRPCGKPFTIQFNGVDCYPIGQRYFTSYSDLGGIVKQYHSDDPDSVLFTDAGVTCFAAASFYYDGGYNPAYMLFYSRDKVGSTTYETATTCTQILEFQKSQVGKAKLTGKTKVKKGRTATYTLRVPVTLTNYWGDKEKFNTKVMGKVKWTSSKVGVATVSSTGKLTAKKCGAATITASDASGTYKSAKKVTVRIGKQKLKVSPRNKTVDASRNRSSSYSYRLTVKGAKGKVTYKVDSNARNAGVKVSRKGKVTLPKKWNGMATIMVKAAQTSKYFATTKKVHVYCW